MVSFASSRGASGADTDKADASSSFPPKDASVRAVPNCSARLSPDSSRVSCSFGEIPSNAGVVQSYAAVKPTAAGGLDSTVVSSLPSCPLWFWCAGILAVYACLCAFCPSVFVGGIATILGGSSRVAELRKIFHFYCLRPRGGADAARALTSPILVVSALYLPFVFLLQGYMRSRTAFRLKWACVAWNFLLSCLSGIGFIVMLISQPSLVLRPVLPELEFTPPVRAVICIFTLSKAVEYGDTVLLVLRKKPLIFLHLYHHLTVTLYCWHAQLVLVSVGHYFAFLNLVIHSWMYLYYALAALFPCHPLLRTWRPLITVSQILQMCVGLTLASYALSQDLSPNEKFNATLAAGMYISYAILFVQFFYKAYIRRSRKSRSTSPLATPLQLLILIHLLAAAGLYLLLTHSRRSTLLLEILSFSAATAAVLPFVIRAHHKKYRSTQSFCYRSCMPSLIAADTAFPRSCSTSPIRQTHNTDTINHTSTWSGTTSSPLSIHSSDNCNVSCDATGSQSAVLLRSRNVREDKCTHSSSSVISSVHDRTGVTAVAEERKYILRGEINVMPFLSQHESARGSGSNSLAAVKPQLQQTSGEQLQQHSSENSMFTARSPSPVCRLTQNAFVENKEDVLFENRHVAVADDFVPAPEQQLGIKEDHSAVVAASPLPLDSPKQSQDTGGDSRSISNSTRRTTDTCCERIAAAALQENPDAILQQGGSQHGISGSKSSDVVVFRVSNSSAVFRGSESSSSRSCLSGISDSAELGRMTSPAAAAEKERKVNFVITALQSGGQTLLTISNFLLACALKRLIDVQEAAATAASGRAGDGASIEQKDLEQELDSGVAMGKCCGDGNRDDAVVTTTTSAATTEENSRTIMNLAHHAVENQKEMREREQQQQRDVKEIEIQRVCQLLSEQSCCNSSAEPVLLKAHQLAEQHHQQTGAAAGVGKQQQKDSSPDFFCEENSSTVCSSPENLVSTSLYNSVAAGKSSVAAAAAAADTDSTGVQTAASSRAVENTTPPLDTCSPVHYSFPPTERAMLSEVRKSEASHSEKHLESQGEEENIKELLSNTADSMPQPSPSISLETREKEILLDVLNKQRKLQEGLHQQQAATHQEQVRATPSAPSRVESSSKGTQNCRYSVWSREISLGLHTSQHDINKTTASAQLRDVLLAAMCAGVPAFYGWLIHGNALLGLCVHGALRWLLELYTSRTFYSGRTRMFPASGGPRSAAAQRKC